LLRSIDPFGASSALNRLYKKMGFLGTVFQRIGYKKKLELIQNKNMEFFWKPNEGVHNQDKFLTHIMNNNYCVIIFLKKFIRFGKYLEIGDLN
jgi:hypothetical protein